ncbi:MAG: TIGR03746 family integrating conjugative element protein [Roseicyclus sp.]|nr:TIGR03746 family integrating conjugative element protein [Roseicyclus sp.]
MNVTLLFIVIALIALCFNLSRSIDLAGKEQLIRLEPDLRVGTVRNAWEVPPAFVYSFALTIVQKINNWQNNGSKDYSKNIMMLQNYITPSCRAFLTSDFKQKKQSGQLQNRTRIVMEMSGVGFNEGGNTRLITRGQWDVYLSLNVREFIGNKLVKNKDVFWPVKVVEFNVDSELNTQGLALDCFSGNPKLLKDHRI